MTFPTLLTDLDNLLGGGFRPSSLVVVGGRPAMGKTAFLMTCANNLINQNIKFLYVSLESKIEYLVDKMVYNNAEVSMSKKTNEVLDGIEFQRIVASSVQLKKSDVTFIGEKNIDTIRDFITKNSDIKIVLIDYLQLMLYQSAYEDTSRIITELKNICLQNEICIVVTSQLTRQVEERVDHRPMLKDFRDSGVIEETADQTIMILRREYYDPMDKPGLAELIIQKNRYGECGSVFTRFTKEYMKYDNLKNIRLEKIKVEDKRFSAFCSN